MALNQRIILDECSEILQVLRSHDRETYRRELRDTYYKRGEQMLDAICTATEQERAELRARLTQTESHFLYSVAFSRAVAAVKRGRETDLRYGLLALLIEDVREDFRETLRHLALLAHSAELIGCHIEDIFATIRQYGTASTVEFFDDYIDRGDRRLSSMGYRASQGEDGFTYESTI